MERLRASLSDLPLLSANKSLKRSHDDEARSESNRPLKTLPPRRASVLMRLTQRLQATEKGRGGRERMEERKGAGEREREKGVERRRTGATEDKELQGVHSVFSNWSKKLHLLQ